MPKETFKNLPYEKKKRIIEGAKKAFSETHYKKVTIDTIVNYAEIPKGSFYQYFLNKDDLFRYIFRNIGLDKNDALVEEIKKTSNMEFSDMIIKIIARAREFETQDEVMIALKNRFLKECPQELKEEILLDVMPESMALFEKIISIYINKGEFRKDFNIKTAVFMITSTVLNLDKYNLEKESDHGEVLKNALDILAKGLRKSE